MKTLAQTAYNYLAAIPEEGGGKFIPSVEVALTLAEPVYQLGNDGEMCRVRTTETVRFVASPDKLRLFAKSLKQAADDCDLALSETLREHVDEAMRRATSSAIKQHVAAAPSTTETPST